jgi:hypothetical protein
MDANAPHSSRFFSLVSLFLVLPGPAPDPLVGSLKEGVQSMTLSFVLAMRAHDVLRQSPIPVLRRLHVDESEQEIILSGAVSSYYLKQLAQEALMPVLGSRQLHNRILVIRP